MSQQTNATAPREHPQVPRTFAMTVVGAGCWAMVAGVAYFLAYLIVVYAPASGNERIVPNLLPIFTSVAAIFGVTEGGTGLVAAPTGDAQIVFKVTEVFEPAGADANSVPEDAQKSFASGMADDLLDQLVAKLQSEYGVTVNRSAIEQALAF